MYMGIALLEAFLGCVHRHRTFPQTPVQRKGDAAPATIEHTYVACLDCGKVLPYDWNKMREITPDTDRPVTPIRRAVLWVRFIAAS